MGLNLFWLVYINDIVNAKGLNIAFLLTIRVSSLLLTIPLQQHLV